MLSIRVSSWGLSVHGGGRVLVRGASYVCDGAVECWLGRRAPRSEEAIHRSSVQIDVQDRSGRVLAGLGERSQLYST
jgi:hypothetical protein